MGALDTSGIDLDPARFRCRADLVVCLQQLHTKSGGPSYRDLEETGKSMGIKLSSSTIGDLIGEKSATSTRKLAWKTVELFLLVCNVPETELNGWRAAWEAAMAPDKPPWPEERQHLLTTIDQLTTELAASKDQVDQLTTDLAAAEACTDQFAAAKERIAQLTTDLAAAEDRTSQLTTDLAAAEPRIDQLTAAVEEAEARALAAEAMLASRPAQSSVLELPESRISVLDLPSRRDRILFVFGLPEPLERLRVKAETFYNAKDYAYAANLYKQIATQVEHKYKSMPGYPLVLAAQRRYLEIETEASVGSKVDMRFRVLMRRKLNARWRHLICEYQRHMSEDSRKIFEVRLEHIYWVAVLLNRGRKSIAISHARKLLIDLYADCKNSLTPGDPFAAKVAEYADCPDRFFYSRPKRHRWKFGIRPQPQARHSVFRYGDTTT